MLQYIEWMHSTIDSYIQVASTVHEYLPNLIGALIFLFVGWLAAHLVKFVVLKLGTVLHKVIATVASQFGFGKIKPHPAITSIIANTLFWIIILFTLGTILRTLGWPGFLLLLHDYFPRLLGSLMILLSGYVIGHLIAYMMVNYKGIKEVKYAQTLSKISKLIIVSFAVVMALEYLGFDMMLFKYLFLIIITCVLLGASLAFGVGARHAISHLLAMRNVRQFYHIGQIVKVNDIKGQVIDIKSHVIILQTKEGKAIVPGDIFYENITLLLDTEKNA
ncbi:MAG: hypothetical protein ABSF18_01825 [Gammaproteobacteria bacterium]|jgi:hypothetical protein